MAPTAADLRFLACIRALDGNGNYRAVSNGRYGAYQFGQDKWNEVAGRQGWSDLVGKRPDLASDSDQDDVALALHREPRERPWDGRCL